jgi:hypothetical protein
MLLVAVVLVSGATARVAETAAALPATASVSAEAATPPDDTPPDDTPPETIPPDDTPPDDTLETTVPSTPNGVTSDSTATSDDNLVVAVIAVIGFGVLVAVAGWWMVRRRDIDDGSPPRPNPGEGPPHQDLI